MWLNAVRPCRPAAGFTLVEVLVASLLMLIVTATIFGTFRYQLYALKTQTSQLEAQQAARSMMDLMSREVRLAGYDPTCAKTFVGLNDAGPQRLQVQFDRNADGTIGAGESITYSYDADLQQISRNAGSGAIALLGSLPGNALAFSYYDGGGVLLAPTGQPPALSATQRNQVRRVKITLVVQRANPAPLNASPVVSKLTSNVDLRNRFLNNGVGCL